jgi:CDP-glucose 4,6-dehydratase
MESLEVTMNWNRRRVLLTGHTGFKGSWLSLWLQSKGADLCGFALEPPTKVNMFEVAGVAEGMRSVFGDTRDAGLLKQTFAEFRPEVVFHLAAQASVRKSYVDPLGTYSTNVMGTANLLEAARHSDGLRAVVVITSDKCYLNHEWEWPYRETDLLGGYDPYSNSKACAELVVAAYRDSFFNAREYRKHGVAVASVRAGNVIGGGDWEESRIVPDTMRAFMSDRPVRLRSPRAIRPWQHVLEPLRGYLTLAEFLCERGVAGAEAWNFGPDQSDAQPVEWVVREMAHLWGPRARWENDEGIQPHEANHLTLDSSKASGRLGWRPELRLTDALAMTVAWYQAYAQQQDMGEFTPAQIMEYDAKVRASASLKPGGVHV